jgi:inosine-uridine nucleoside N-ribohydrolase
MERTFTERDMAGFFLHDPLAVAVGIDPRLVSGTARAANVVSDGEVRGKTILGEARASSLVAMQVDAERFISELGEALGIPSAHHTVGLERSE